MSDPQQLDQELREYLKKEPNLRGEDKLNYLRTIFNKHLEFNKLEHVVNSGDLFEIMSAAKNDFSNRRVPVRVSKKQVDSGDVTQISVMEAFIGYLNKMHLLKKKVRFDYTE